MIKRVELVKYLDELLEIQLWEGIDSSLNGLQVEGVDEISSVALAVDGCEQTFEMCLETGAQMRAARLGGPC